MRLAIYLSLALNVAVLVPVCLSLVTGAGWTQAAYGPASPARAILLSVYGAILVASVLLMMKPVPAMVAALLLVQVIYKIMTPFTVGTLANPVVISNLAIAAFHIATVWTIWKHGGI